MYILYIYQNLIFRHDVFTPRISQNNIANELQIAKDIRIRVIHCIINLSIIIFYTKYLLYIYNILYNK